MREIEAFALKKFDSLAEEDKKLVLDTLTEMEIFLAKHKFTAEQIEKVLYNLVYFSRKNDIYSFLSEFYIAKNDPRDLLR